MERVQRAGNRLCIPFRALLASLQEAAPWGPRTCILTLHHRSAVGKRRGLVCAHAVCLMLSSSQGRQGSQGAGVQGGKID